MTNSKRFSAGLIAAVLGGFFMSASPAHATTSTIDPTQPGQNSPLLSQTIRTLAQAAANDINALWTAVGNIAVGGSNGQLLANINGQQAGVTIGGDGSLNAAAGMLTITKTNGVLFAPSATVDTTYAPNITSGILPAGRMPAFSGSCTSSPGSTVLTCSASGSGTVNTGSTGQFAYYAANGTTVSPITPGTSVSANTGTSGAVLGFLNGNNTHSGVDTFTAAPQINLNGSSLPSALAGTVLRTANANSTATRIEADAFANSAFFTGVRYDGTAVSPTALQSGDEIGGYNGWGYTGSGVAGPAGSFSLHAAANWSSSSTPTYASIYTTPIGTTAEAEVLRVWPDGSVAIGTTQSMGAGTINVGSSVYAHGAPLSGGSSIPVGTTGQYLGYLANGSTVSPITATTVTIDGGSTGWSFTNGTFPMVIQGTGGGTGGPSTVNVISTGTTNTLSSLSAPRTTQAWNSASTGGKTQTIPGCTSGIAGYDITVVDEIGDTEGYNVTPLSGTIQKSGSFTFSNFRQSVTFECDGVSNWMGI